MMISQRQEEVKSCFTPLKPRLRDTHLDTSLFQTVHLQPYKHSISLYMFKMDTPAH